MKTSPKDRIVLTAWQGRFGNRMHSYLYGVNYARRHGLEFFMPSQWEGSVLFRDVGAKVLDNEPLRLALIESARVLESLENRKRLVEEHTGKAGPPLSFLDPNRAVDDGVRNVYYEGLAAFQNHVYEKYSMREIRSVFHWSDAVLESDIYRRMAAKRGQYSVAHLRRGDIANLEWNQKRATGYSVISKRSYERAFERFGVPSQEVVWVTDDRTGAWGIPKNERKHNGWRFPEGSRVYEDIFFEWFEDFLLMHFARNVFRANSSFSWWAACLSPEARIFSPVLTERRNWLGEDDEIDVEFVEGNEPHWFGLSGRTPCDRIRIPD